MNRPPRAALYKGVLVALGCPGPACPLGLWPVNGDLIDPIEDHIEEHIKQLHTFPRAIDTFERRILDVPDDLDPDR
jgi:hypothetical protein